MYFIKNKKKLVLLILYSKFTVPKKSSEIKNHLTISKYG